MLYMCIMSSFRQIEQRAENLVGEYHFDIFFFVKMIYYFGQIYRLKSGFNPYTSWIVQS